MGFEWNEVTRHWWRYDNAQTAMVHRASGEVITYRGPISETGWHRFDYEHRDGRYPLIVELKSVSYPNPSTDSFNVPPWNAGSTPILTRRLWHVDHLKSVKTWKDETATSEPPPYWLWHRADIAICEAGLLWPDKCVVSSAEEISVSAGWANGQWREHYYRRIGWILPLHALLPHYRMPQGAIFALPISDHVLTPRDATCSSWRTCASHFIDGAGKDIGGRSIWMESSDGVVLAKPSDATIHFDSPRVQPLTSLWEGLYLTTPIACIDQNGRARREIRPTARWYISLSSYSAIGRIESRGEGQNVALDGRRLVTRRDIFSSRKSEWKYDGAIIDRAVSSLRLWRKQFDIRMNALPYSQGLEPDSLEEPLVQGEVGTVELAGGFIGGLMGSFAQVRLSLVAKTDSTSFDWRRFF